MKSHSVLPGVCLSWVTTGPEQGWQACLQLRPPPQLTSRSLSASLHGSLRVLSDCSAPAYHVALRACHFASQLPLGPDAFVLSPGSPSTGVG